MKTIQKVFIVYILVVIAAVIVIANAPPMGNYEHWWEWLQPYYWLLFIFLVWFWETINRYIHLRSVWADFAGLIAISIFCGALNIIDWFFAFGYIVLCGCIVAYNQEILHTQFDFDIGERVGGAVRAGWGTVAEKVGVKGEPVEKVEGVKTGKVKKSAAGYTPEPPRPITTYGGVEYGGAPAPKGKEIEVTKEDVQHAITTERWQKMLERGEETTLKQAEKQKKGGKK